eukprot:jgi/Hompol1/5983/HPOL_001250-RA
MLLIIEQAVTLNTQVIEHCFDACITDFTSRVTSAKEHKCLDRCVTKFTNYAKRISLRYEENQPNLQKMFESSE